MFFDCVDIADKRRVHFHEFMQEVHDRLHVERSRESADPILPVADSIAAEALSQAFSRLTDFPVEDREHVPSERIAIKGDRELFVPESLKGVAVFSFKRLCGEPRGIPDYMALAHRYHTVILVGIPALDANQKSEAARFKTLIDTLYENGVKLLASADRAPDTLYCASEDAFEFERTVSRLNEMGSQDYLARGHGVSDELAAAQLGDQSCLIPVLDQANPATEGEMS